MGFDEAFSIIVCWQTLLFGIVIYMITQFLRSWFQNWPHTKAWTETNWLWKDMILPFGPIGIALAIVFLAPKFPWPEALGNIRSAKLFYAVFCGMACGMIYARLRAWLGVAADKGSPLAAKVLKRPTTKPPPDNCPPVIEPEPEVNPESQQ